MNHPELPNIRKHWGNEAASTFSFLVRKIGEKLYEESSYVVAYSDSLIFDKLLSGGGYRADKCISLGRKILNNRDRRGEFCFSLECTCKYREMERNDG